ncbi:MAG TPA: DUF3078 domain-containing protein [Draconibacterium sp.]|nr:DUF3078 domain-containing protein [Draconibacterium sp.]
MIFDKLKSLLLLFLILFISIHVAGQTSENEDENETLQMGIQILKRYFYDDNEWYIAKPSVAKDVKGLINFIEDEPIDTIINNVFKSFSQKQTYVFRLPENVADSLTVPGFYAYPLVQKRIENINLQLKKEFENKQAGAPPSLFENMDEKLKLIPKGKGMQLFTESVYTMPKDLQIPEVIPDSVLNSPGAFEKLVRLDSIRAVYVEQKRINYNDSIRAAYVDSVNNFYGKKAFAEELNYQVRRFSDSVKVNNYNVLRMYNESVVNAVNDSISAILGTLAEYADFIDSTKISMYNLSGNSTEIGLKSGDERFARFWLKNVQNDSLSVLIRSVGKNGMFMLIDDGVTISRYKPKETKKDFDFKSLEKNIASLTAVGKSYEVETPWVIGGEGNVGFTQTYLQNWKKGGQSAISSLIVLRGFANYKRADGLIKWDNSGEFRNGWIRPGGKEEQLQKNDDRFEITSRFGVSAYKKWFYSSEFSFETQFFKGYEYPRTEDDNPISAFMAPSRMFFKVGMEYKPNKEFSLLLSPFTIKNVYVRDTVLIDQTKFGIDANKKSFWEPGLMADLFYKKSITKDITYETKYKMFLNYKEPFQKFDINWENIFVMKLTNYVNMRFLVHFLYDDDVLFPIYDDNEVKIGEEPKLQIKEFFSIGFTYKINHNVMHSKRIR